MRFGGALGASATVVLVLAAGGCASDGKSGTKATGAAVGKAEKRCAVELDKTLGESTTDHSATSEDFFTVSDGGKTVSVDGPVEGDSGALFDLQAVTCVLNTLKAPDSITEKMLQTRALDGRQSDEWSTYEVSWSYHPDDGFNAIVETK